MTIVVLNASPRPKGTVSTLLRAVVDGVGADHDARWIDLPRLKVKPCTGCVRCRPDGGCVLPEDDGHAVARLIEEADALIVGTPTYWGNMSGQLKVLFDRLVPTIMGESPRGLPLPRHKGKPMIVVTACTSPWPFNVLAAQSRGAVRAVHEVLGTGGFRNVGSVVQPGTKGRSAVSPRQLRRAQRLGEKLVKRIERAARQQAAHPAPL